MQLLFCGIDLLFIAMVGVAALAWIAPRRRAHWAELGGLAFAGGIGLTGVLLFDLSLAGVVPSWLELGAVFFAAAIALAIAVVTGRRPARLGWPRLVARQWDARTLLGALAFVVLLAAFANVAVTTLTTGLADVDAFGIWMLKAKVAYLSPLAPIPAALTDPSMSYSHQDYPLGFPMVVAGAYAAVGRIDELMGKLVLLPVYASLVLVVYGAMRQLLPARRAEAVGVTAVFAAAPVLTQHAGMAVAEVPLVLMHACCLVMLLRWMRDPPELAPLVLAAVFASFAAFAKNEGLALLPLIALASLAFALLRPRRDGASRRHLFGQWLIAWLFSLALIAPWLVYRRHLPRTHEDYGGRLTSFATVLHDLPRLRQVLPAYLGLFVQLGTAGGIWILLVVSVFVGWRRFRSPAVLTLWFVLLAHAAVYVLTFMVTPWDQSLLLPMVGPKLLMHVTPNAALLIGLHLSDGGGDVESVAVASPAGHA